MSYVSSRPLSDRFLTLYIDGASRGNPGRAGAGVWVTDEEGQPLRALGRYLGRMTNNEAEYWALLIGIREAKRMGAAFIRVYTDSELIAKQVNGIYRVRHPNLKSLHQAVLDVLKGFRSYEVIAIPREGNAQADRLANQAIDGRIAREKEGEIREERMAASPQSLERGRKGKRKVRAPEGRVVRNTDCPDNEVR